MEWRPSSETPLLVLALEAFLAEMTSPIPDIPIVLNAIFISPPASVLTGSDSTPAAWSYVTAVLPPSAWHPAVADAFPLLA